MFGIQEICSEEKLRYKDFVDHLKDDHEIPVVENGSWIEKTFRLEDEMICKKLWHILIFAKYEDAEINVP